MSGNIVRLILGLSWVSIVGITSDVLIPYPTIGTQLTRKGYKPLDMSEASSENWRTRIRDYESSMEKFSQYYLSGTDEEKITALQNKCKQVMESRDRSLKGMALRWCFEGSKGKPE